MGQGRENARSWLNEHPDTVTEIAGKLMALFKAPPAAKK
ncbi:MAG: hypothetical protein WCP33_05000 [Deltaproteobacteria bacterium]